MSDFERPLNKRGRKAAPLMAEFLRSRELVPELVIASSAERARQTADRLTKTWTGNVETIFDGGLYHAGPLPYLTSLKEHAGSHQCVMVIGHNPGLEDLIEALTGEDAWMPTAAVAVITCEGTWRSLQPCRLLEVLRPREIFEED